MERAAELYLEAANKRIEAVKLYLEAVGHLKAAGSSEKEIHDTYIEAVDCFEEAEEDYSNIPDGTPGKAEVENELCELAKELIYCGYPDLELRALSAAPDSDRVLPNGSADELYCLAISQWSDAARLWMSASEKYRQAGNGQQADEVLLKAANSVEEAFKTLPEVTEGARWKPAAKAKLIKECQTLANCKNSTAAKRAKKLLGGSSGGGGCAGMIVIFILASACICFSYYIG